MGSAPLQGNLLELNYFSKYPDEFQVKRRQLTFTWDRARLPRQVGWAAVAVGGLLFLFDVIFSYSGAIPYGGIRGLCNLAKEDSFAAWVSWVVGLFAAFAAWGVYLQSRKRGWAAIALIFAYLAADDGAKIHERVGSAAKTLVAGSFLSAYPSYAWQIVFLPIFGAAGIFMLWFLWRDLKSRELKLTLLAAFACYSVAIFFDYMEGIPTFYDVLARVMHVPADAVEHFGRVTEELLELAGTTLFLLVFLKRFLGSVQSVELRVT